MGRTLFYGHVVQIADVVVIFVVRLVFMLAAFDLNLFSHLASSIRTLAQEVNRKI